MSKSASCSCCNDDSPSCYCPLTGVINTLSKKYAMQLINVIGVHGPLRFSDLEAHLSSINSSTLSDRLAELVEADLVTRTQYNEIPPHVEYDLTEEGDQLRERLEPLLAWAANRT